ncbi:L-threonylcarbamoyladenylate synthase [uncultured Arcanobacterium sp.]|uniref:L-threonylcarbamoyladenylate synthase n=1 Tax=uncultured Arcanobacterium sp. TaxID=487520 RepID=UPI002635DC55|nr:L-threonylcarbamoyladenylate synthase [uncultured Arcanobacterium sp.]
MQIWDCQTAEKRSAAIAQALASIERGEVICLPTDTVYGIGADPFNAGAVNALLTAKSRTRQKPSPVLVANIGQVLELVADFPDPARALAAAFWPGALTMIFPARPTLGWDLGETHGTVALRMPNHPFTLALLEKTGPLAVTSANKSGNPPALRVETAQEQLGEAISLYLDGGKSPGGTASTIVSFSDTAPQLHILRAGAISAAALAEVTQMEVVE